MVIATYHRIIAAEKPAAGFYDVSVRDLAIHLDILRARGAGQFDPAAPGPGQYALTFDDGTRGHFDHAFPLLRERTERAVFFIPTQDIGRPDRMTADEVRALAAAGQIIGCHSHEHRRLDLLDAAAVRVQIETSCRLLHELTGVAPQWFAPPGGYVNATVRRMAADHGLRWLRSMRWGLNRHFDPLDLECVPLNRHVDPSRFARLIEGRGLARFRALYFAKQLLKKLLPLSFYTRLRRRLPLEIATREEIG